MLRPDLADWDLLVEAIREIARRCRSLGLTLSVENNWAYWDGIDPTLPLGAYDPAQFVEYYGTSPDEWLRLAKDVNEPNVSLCLDPSHAVPYAHRWPVDERGKVMDQYLVDLGLLGHLHWNDSDLYDPRGRDDLHLPVGTGTLGEGFHRALKGWARETGRIALLEHFVDRASLERELAYIAVL
jgi:sugar phosphate isomerase/epimerase